MGTIFRASLDFQVRQGLPIRQMLLSMTDSTQKLVDKAGASSSKTYKQSAEPGEEGMHKLVLGQSCPMLEIPINIMFNTCL